ncbi:MAG: hypothetical protein KJ799_04620 [Bacteroidetes bacterium]|nr:hypothetical protein [Bacteroidota bacterium]
MNTNHKLIFGNCMDMSELNDESVHLIVTSPPYYNAPFDYDGLFVSYEQYLGVLNNFGIIYQIKKLKLLNKKSR